MRKYTVFCRTCHYDLRGQQSTRCPECGTEFAFDDPESYLRAAPGRFAILGRLAEFGQGVLLSFRERRNDVILLMTSVLLFFYLVALTQLGSASTCHGRVLERVNLRQVTIAWSIQKSDNPEQSAFDVELAKQNKYLRLSWSPYSEIEVMRRKVWVSGIIQTTPWFAIPTLAYLLLISILVGWRVRRIAIATPIVLLLLWLATAYRVEILDRLCPKSYAYLNDIVVVSDADLSDADPQPNQTICVYDAESFLRKGRRGIAFADGHVDWLRDDQAKPLFEAQGIPYPKHSD